MYETVWFNDGREDFFSVERILEIVTGEKALQFVGIKSSQDSSVSEWDIFIP